MYTDDDHLVVMDFSADGGARVVTDTSELADFYAHRQYEMGCVRSLVHVHTYRLGWSVADARCLFAACTVQPWFHAMLTHDDAVHMFKEAGFDDGYYTRARSKSYNLEMYCRQFLVRTSTHQDRFVLCLAYNKRVLDYAILMVRAMWCDTPICCS
jgi:hypothetical protein